MIGDLKKNKKLFEEKTNQLQKSYDTILNTEDNGEEVTPETLLAFSHLLMDTERLKLDLAANTQELIRNALYWLSYLGFLVGAGAGLAVGILTIVATPPLAILIVSIVGAAGYIGASIFMCAATLWRIFREMGAQLEHEYKLKEGKLTPYMQITVAILCTLLMLLQLGWMGLALGLSFAFPPAAPFIFPAAALVIGVTTFLTPVLCMLGLAAYRFARQQKAGVWLAAAIGLTVAFSMAVPPFGVSMLLGFGLVATVAATVYAAKYVINNFKETAIFSIKFPILILLTPLALPALSLGFIGATVLDWLRPKPEEKKAETEIVDINLQDETSDTIEKNYIKEKPIYPKKNYQESVSLFDFFNCFGILGSKNKKNNEEGNKEPTDENESLLKIKKNNIN